MRIFIQGVQTYIEISHEKPVCFLFDNSTTLFRFYQDITLLNQGESGTTRIFSNEKDINFETEVEIIDNILNININTRKMITALHKKITTKISMTDIIFDIDKINIEITTLIDNIQKETLINMEHDENLQLLDLLKLYNVRFINTGYSLAEKFQRYLDILIEYSKVKLVIVPFSLMLISEEEQAELITHCRLNKICLLFLEIKRTTLVSQSLYDIINLDLLV